MKLIQINSRKYKNIYTKVDDSDYEWLNQWKWGLLNGNGWIYICRRPTINKKQIAIFMANEIMKPYHEMVIDHKNHDTFDNRKENLRICSRSENQRNAILSKNNTSGITGVSWVKPLKKWSAQINIYNKHIHLGVFKCKLQAQTTRKNAEQKYFGEFAYKL